MINSRCPRLVLAAVTVGLAMLTACGAPAAEQSADATAAQEHEQHDGHSGEHADTGAEQAQPGGQHHHGSGGPELWATQTAALGIVVLDGGGRIVYRSDADSIDPPVSRCTGECAQRWVPLTVPDGQEPELLGVTRDRVSTVRRDDGSLQVALAGWPLYTVAGDPGGHDGMGSNGAEGIWFAVTPTGEKAMP